jgi:hypothetical protein
MTLSLALLSGFWRREKIKQVEGEIDEKLEAENNQALPNENS